MAKFRRKSPECRDRQLSNVYESTADWYDAVFYSRAPLRDPFAQEQHQPDMDVGLRCAIPVAP